MFFMRNLFWLKLAMMIGVTGSLSAGTIQYQVTPVSGNSFRFDYSVSGFTFAAHEQLDIQFDPTLYGTLSNGVAPANFIVTLLQTNNPPGESGDYTAMAQINNPSTAGLFSVQAVYLGKGQPGSQPFFINQFNSDGFYVATTVAGFTTSPVPEPSTAGLFVIAVLLGGLWMVLGRRAASLQ